ncbi:MAG: DUF3347 domain-containing protein [Chitinophagaceae bacterium]
MKKVFAVLGILLLLLAGYIWYSFKGGKKQPKGPKPESLAISKHSPAFNQSVQSLLDAYYFLSEAFVNWDTASIAANANILKAALDSLKVEELKVDTTGIYETALDPLANAKNEAANILKEASIDNKRTAFNNLSENLRLLFIVVKYDQGKLYWQECPMAFGDDQPGYWLSKTDDVRNPYLGTSHPRYKDGMLHCGGPKDTINFMTVDRVNIK